MTRAILFLLVLFTAACSTTDYEGFKRHKDGVHYRLEYLGDELKPFRSEGYVSAKFIISRLDGDVVAHKNIRRIQYPNLTLPARLHEILDKGHEGDSLIILGSVSELELDQWLRPLTFDSAKQVVQISVKIDEVLSSEQLIAQRAKERMLADLELQGAKWLKMAIDSLQFKDDEFRNGIYFRMTNDEPGEVAQSGSYATVHYKTSLPNGKLVDDTYRGDPLEYELGRPDQVLDGFAIGMSFLSPGDKAIMLIPQELGFKDKGSSSGIVPPFAPLIYEVELVDSRI